MYTLTITLLPANPDKHIRKTGGVELIIHHRHALKQDLHQRSSHPLDLFWTALIQQKPWKGSPKTIKVSYVPKGQSEDFGILGLVCSLRARTEITSTSNEVLDCFLTEFTK